MFGFIGKFKTEVYAGFESVKQRLVTLEAKVEALFEHTRTVAQAEVAPVVEAAAKVEAVATDAVKAVDDAKQV